MEGKVGYNPGRVDNEKYPARDDEVSFSGCTHPIQPPFPTPRRVPMSIEEIKKRFVNEIKLRAYDDKYIDKNEEREILQIAIQLGVGIDSARSALVQVCDEHSYVMESVVNKMIKDQVESAFGNDGQIDQKEFDLI